MTYLSDDELKAALARAAERVARTDDPDHLARALILLHRRLALLEHVHRAAEHFLQFGLSAQHHQELQRAVDAVRREKWASGDDKSSAPL
jgi:hypothetical protein